MKIQFFSDLHLEMSEISFRPADDIDLVVSAGDLNVGAKGVEWSVEQSNRHSLPWIYVIGNHEYYHGDLQSTLSEIRATAHGTQVYVLERDVLLLEGIRFLGVTLWTDFRLHMETHSAINECWERVHDFSRILDRKGGKEITPYTVMEIHRDSLHWIAQQIEQPFEGKTVVVSHHAPTKQSIDPRFQERKLSAAYASSLEYLFVEHEIVAWIHGHVHRSVDERIHGVRLLANPRGYCGENSHFLIDQVVEI